MNGTRPRITERQRLACVMGKCFAAMTPATKTAMRHAVLSAKLGREIKSSDDLTDAEVKQLLTLWEHFDAPFSPSDKAKQEIAELAKAYQNEAGQEALPI